VLVEEGEGGRGEEDEKASPGEEGANQYQDKGGKDTVERNNEAVKEKTDEKEE
jgi:hypothetical protein